MKATKMWPCLILLMLVTGISGCGGSDNDNPDNTDNTVDTGDNPDTDNGDNTPPSDGNSDNKTMRVLTYRYDYDNNGVFEATADYHYDTSGRVDIVSYTYTDDGTTDANFESFSLRPGNHELAQTTTYTYYPDGLLEQLVYDDTDSRTELNFTWRSDAQIDNALFNTFDSSGGLIARLEFRPDFDTDNKLTGWQSFNLPNTDVLQELTISYDNNNQISKDLWTISPATGLQEERTFTWRSNGQIDRLDSINPDPNSDYQASVDFIYDTNNRLTETIHTLPDQVYSWVYVYDTSGQLTTQWIDLDNDDTYEAKIEIAWEEAPCEPVIFWAPRTESGLRKPAGANYHNGDGHTPLGVCAASF